MRSCSSMHSHGDRGMCRSRSRRRSRLSKHRSASWLISSVAASRWGCILIVSIVGGGSTSSALGVSVVCMRILCVLLCWLLCLCCRCWVIIDHHLFLFFSFSSCEVSEQSSDRRLSDKRSRTMTTRETKGRRESTTAKSTQHDERGRTEKEERTHNNHYERRECKLVLMSSEGKGATSESE